MKMKLKFYDVSKDEYREPIQNDIDVMQHQITQFGALKRICKILGQTNWNEYKNLEDKIIK